MTHTVHDLPTPALLVDLDILERNLVAMRDRADELGVRLRPHVKTHKCVEIAERQRALGAHGITVSTLVEARVFADHGFDDITWAFPIVLSRLGEARHLAERVTLRVVVDSSTAVDALSETGFPFHVWIKVDGGYHRAGVDPESPAAVELAERVTADRRLVFDGLLSHAGHAYQGPGREEIAAAEATSRDLTVGLAERLRTAGIDVPAVSVGSTPGMHVVDHYDGVDEARPGNYALHDVTQVALGSCDPAACAASVLATVVSSSADHAVIDAGALALSKDTGRGDLGTPTMGELLEHVEGGVFKTDRRVVSLSQEHGIVNASLDVGERVRVVPNHACLAVACFDRLHAVRDGKVVDTWKVWRGR